MDSPNNTLGSIDPFAEPSQNSAEYSAVPANSSPSNNQNNIYQETRQATESVQDSLKVGSSSFVESSSANVSLTKSSSVKKKLHFVLKAVFSKSGQNRIYRFDVSTNLPEYKKRRYFNIERTQSEFEKLARHLAVSYPQCLVLSFPYFSILLDSEPEIENTIRSFVQTWLDWVSFHQILQNDYELRKFVEAPFIFNPSIILIDGIKSKFEVEYDKFANSSTGLFNNWKSKKTYKPIPKPKCIAEEPSNNTNSSQDTPGSQAIQPKYQTFDDKFEYVKYEFNVISQPLPACGDSLLRLQQKCVQAQKTFDTLSVHSAALGSVDLGKQHKLAVSLSALGKIEKSISLVLSAISSAYIPQLFYYISNLENTNNDIQRSLQNRAIIFKDYGEAKHVLERKKQAVNILRASSTIKPNVVDESLKSVEEAKNIEAELRQKAEQVDKLLSIDIRKFKVVRNGLFVQMFRSWASNQLSLDKQLLGEYKSALKQIQQASTGSFCSAKSENVGAPKLDNSIKSGSAYKERDHSASLSPNSSITPGISSIFAP
ncbi:hypothetical protein BB560_001100 [Smittium megazygosporum]|uniref:PX domain-containing protein n=1 Tax=Smittium megazygosporum TaxID=133381 RepID=A0A2T9ZIJ6_9FUNG|nr:hypothetical protein BB560_001100 [Smittium megazygosporum]